MPATHALSKEADPEVSAIVRSIAARLEPKTTGAPPAAPFRPPAGATGVVPEAAPVADRALLEQIFAYVTRAERRIAELNRRVGALQSLTMTDELTGLLNRRGFTDQLRRSLAGAKRYGYEGLVVYCDLDDFKAINDTHGHAAGDAALRHVAAILEGSVRASDFVARLGGDEFAIGLVQTNRRDGIKRARSLQHAIESTSFDWQGTPIGIRISMGEEAFGPGTDPDELICRADMAMYYAKRRRARPFARDAAE